MDSRTGGDAAARRRTDARDAAAAGRGAPGGGGVVAIVRTSVPHHVPEGTTVRRRLSASAFIAEVAAADLARVQADPLVETVSTAAPSRRA